MKALISDELIEKKILLIRGHKVMLSVHLAELYDVETRTLNQAVKRNSDRFPEDFMFQMNEAEAEQLVSQNVIPLCRYADEDIGRGQKKNTRRVFDCFLHRLGRGIPGSHKPDAERLPVSLPAVGNPVDLHELPVVVNLVQNPVISRPYSPSGAGHR